MIKNANIESKGTNIESKDNECSSEYTICLKSYLKSSIYIVFRSEAVVNIHPLAYDSRSFCQVRFKQKNT